MTVRKVEDSAQQVAGKRAYKRPVLRNFGALHMNTRGSGGGTGDGTAGMVMIPPGML